MTWMSESLHRQRCPLFCCLKETKSNGFRPCALHPRVVSSIWETSTFTSTVARACFSCHDILGFWKHCRLFSQGRIDLTEQIQKAQIRCVFCPLVKITLNRIWLQILLRLPIRCLQRSVLYSSNEVLQVKWEQIIGKENRGFALNLVLSLTGGSKERPGCHWSLDVVLHRRVHWQRRHNWL